MIVLSSKNLTTMDQSDEIRRIKKLQRSRTGKKGGITKRITQLTGMAEAGGCSRRQMKYLMEKLVGVYEELVKVCEEISDLCILVDQFDDNNCVEDVRVNVDNCVALVTEHIESRADENTSSSSSSMRTLSWVANLPVQNDEVDRSSSGPENALNHNLPSLAGSLNSGLNADVTPDLMSESQGGEISHVRDPPAVGHVSLNNPLDSGTSNHFESGGYVRTSEVLSVTLSDNPVVSTGISLSLSASSHVTHEGFPPEDPRHRQHDSNTDVPVPVPRRDRPLDSTPVSYAQGGIAEPAVAPKITDGAPPDIKFPLNVLAPSWGLSEGVD